MGFLADFHAAEREPVAPHADRDPDAGPGRPDRSLAGADLAGADLAGADPDEPALGTWPLTGPEAQPLATWPPPPAPGVTAPPGAAPPRPGRRGGLAGLRRGRN